jgi:hypothetical protein
MLAATAPAPVIETATEAVPLTVEASAPVPFKATTTVLVPEIETAELSVAVIVSLIVE